jgi:hypothetical protein
LAELVWHRSDTGLGVGDDTKTAAKLGAEAGLAEATERLTMLE